ncbi:MAG: flagellar type III secretion system pore protein FliP [Clostridiales bacterium]|jgi:flagellar biosynthetic protein FliP|nr:flagellar type III secretion system pore protein FliP [Clostridiales bacterium]
MKIRISPGSRGITLSRRAAFAAVFAILLLAALLASRAEALAAPLPNVSINVSEAETPAETVSSLQVLLVLAVISIAPFILLLFTSFTRVIIALHFVRSALGTQQMPPNQILIGLALFITFFVMSPTLSAVNETAIKPFTAGEITQEEAVGRGMEPIRAFMLRQVETKDVAMFASLAGETFERPEDIPDSVLLPSFVVGEITKGFRFGFYIYMPFIVIDMVVASTLMAMGMMMLPPAMISLPFKVLLFVMVDGWNLVIQNLVKTFK